MGKEAEREVSEKTEIIIGWINSILKNLENNRKKHLETIKGIQGEIKNLNYIKKVIKKNEKI